MSAATTAEMRQVPPPPRAPTSLTISSNLEALLEHEDRVRRMKHGHSNSLASPTFGIGMGLPPPPRRPRNAPASPSPLTPTYSLASTDRDPSDTGSAETLESNPYINEVPHFDEPRTPASPPISPPPRTSSRNFSVAIGKLEPVRGRRDSRGRETSSSPVSTPTSPPADADGAQDRTPSPSTSATSKGTSSPGDSRHPRTSRPLPSLSLRNSTGSTLGHRRERSRSRGKLVKTPTSASQDSMPMRRQRSSHSISVSSLVSADRESFIDFDLSSPSNQPDAVPSPFAAASPPPPSSLPRSPKPPIPTTPKPDFSNRRRHASPSTTALRHTPNAPPPTIPVRTSSADTMPPTTNFLRPDERSQLIRKSRKLTQVFGQTPGAGEVTADGNTSSFLDISPAGTTKVRHRTTASMNMVGQMPASARPRQPLPWPAPNKTIYMDANGRRHSSHGDGDDVASDASSFMDLSASGSGSGSREDDGDDTERETELGPDDSVSVMSASSEVRPFRRKKQISPSVLSFCESLSPEAQAEEERRRRRDKLAKLHRFLGSRVPTNLVLGPGYEDSLPPAVVGLDGTLSPLSPEFGSNSGDTFKGFIKRRRSSSAAVLASTWSSDWDRMKENLNDKEKAIIVRRAQKMEKVFGVVPPQDLFRSSTPTPSGSGARTAPVSPSHSPPSSSPPVSQMPTQRNPNQSSYRRSKISRRPKTGDSGEFLLADAEPSAGSFVYKHYQQSLVSLNDIIDRNDQESLAELHQYLNDEDDAAAQDSQSVSPSKAERRRSLPALLPRASLTSLSSVATMSTVASDATATTPDSTAVDFQARRRRAAKLSHFFGVDYRELIEEVLESIEAGLDAERSQGTLNPAEADALLQKLRTLKTRR
ncbi:hypothetical protein MKEN_01266100 [Mycena kentingensis (nom. inval.)]|nr:hypothetical protein MKEN_01266100 [Mycena kentingensis (nom. inval.)]